MAEPLEAAFPPGDRPDNDPARFMRENLLFLPVPLIPEISLYSAHPASGLRRLADHGGSTGASTPYWAYRWAGGLALARHVLDRPEIVAGRRVLDLGTGSGLVAIAAGRAGAAEIVAVDIDPNAVTAAGLNAVRNDVSLTTLERDILDETPPPTDVILVGDLFYEKRNATRATAFLDTCRIAGVEVLIGDPYRAHLPLARLRLVMEYDVPDFGSGGALRRTGVFSFE